MSDDEELTAAAEPSNTSPCDEDLALTSSLESFPIPYLPKEAPPGTPPVKVGDLVYFWTGRGSHGHGKVSGFKEDRVLIEPDADAVKGSDYRLRPKLGRDWWLPRDRGIYPSQINTPPVFWWKNF